jgi:hypothetical protein
MSDQDGSAAMGITNGQPDFAEYALQGILFVDRWAQWMVWVDSIDGQRCWFKIRTLERLHVISNCFTAPYQSFVIHIEKHRCNFKQCISF